jgi:intracellular sulfur oxidation DsrE/DsrF family protein
MMSDAHRRTLLTLPAAAVLAAAVATTSSAKAASAKNRVVYQVSDANPQMWNIALKNVGNMQAALGAGDVELEVVAYGYGIGMLKGDSPVATSVADALKNGVRIVACQNTMKGMSLKPTDMLPDIGYVPSGVVEVMEKQQQGFAYIRP